jgi:hypothetical protein
MYYYYIYSLFSIVYIFFINTHTKPFNNTKQSKQLRIHIHNDS